MTHGYADQLSFLGDTDQAVSVEVSNKIGESPKTYTGVYAMHKYWSKKPYNLVARYIERHSNPGDIVLDPFCGSGVTIIESVRLRRRAIGVDINPIAVMSTQMGVTPVDLSQLRKTFDFLRHEVEAKIDSLYNTECPQCGNPRAVATHTIWKDASPIEVWVECKVCQSDKMIKPPSEKDSLLPDPVSLWPVQYPTAELLENHRINAKAGMRVCDLFTPRALAALSLLWSTIRTIENTDVRTVMEFCFSAMLPQASQMVFVIRRRGKVNGEQEKGKAEVGSWVIGYWIPTEHFEIHVWRCFENRFRRILKGKQEVNQSIPSSAIACSSFGELSNADYGYWITQASATDLGLPPQSVDYIFTDPPHGNRIPYLELSLMWNAWLGLDFDWEDEIVISEAKNRQKDAADYQQRLALAFRKMWEVLKTDGYISIAFNSLDDETWLSLLNTLTMTGFTITDIAPLEYSARSVIQDTRKNALKTDFVITGQKRADAQSSPIVFDPSLTPLHVEIEDYLSRRDTGAETYEILNHLLIQSLPTGKIFRISQIMETVANLAHFNNGRWRLKQP
ncbi:MAG TPA: DNA methyltransferase [Anaerolineae bacterium]|nr:DNA methyltransferase [Anaerolineae bacterium]